MATDTSFSAQPYDEIGGEVGEAYGEVSEESREGHGWTTTKAAAKALGVSRRTVQDYVTTCARANLRLLQKEKG
jgi:predicted transcriptional regulator